MKIRNPQYRWAMFVIAWLASSAATRVDAQNHSALEQRPQRHVYEGFTEPLHTIMVAASEIGRLESIEVKVGDRVAAGQVIAALDDGLQVAAVRIAALQATMTGEQDAARAESDLQLSRVEKLRVLAKDGVARPDELLRAETDSRVSLARLKAAEEQFDLRQLELQRYQLQLERRKVRVPTGGVVSKVLRKPGEYISPSDPSVAQVLVVEKLLAVFNVPVEETRFVSIGAPARIFLRSTSTTIESTISSIAPDIDGESGTLQIRVELDNAEGRLLAGDRCTLQLISSLNTAQTRSARGAIGR